MDQPEDELKRSLRTATRSLEAAKVSVLLEDAYFVLNRMVDERNGSQKPKE